jgi:hypothetical protein
MAAHLKHLHLRAHPGPRTSHDDVWRTLSAWLWAAYFAALGAARWLIF